MEEAASHRLVTRLQTMAVVTGQKHDPPHESTAASKVV
jgi:hypothetical protein